MKSIVAASLFLCLSLVVIVPAARAQSEQMDIGVRATVVDKPAKSAGKPDLAEAGEYGKVYAILTVQMISSELKLVKPVDAHVLMGQVQHELDTHGFRPVVRGLKPDILITVQYGRAWLRNPYLGDAQTHQTQADGAPTNTITLATKTSPRSTTAGFKSKTQKAEYEKLCIKLTAWQYTTEPKAKAKQLWSTTMIVDDPDHRDLNALAPSCSHPARRISARRSRKRNSISTSRCPRAT